MVKMADLGLRDVRALLASGNAVVTADWTAAELKERTEQGLRKAFGYQAWGIVLPLSRVAELAGAVPHAGDDSAARANVTFSSDPPVLDELYDNGASAGAEQARMVPKRWRGPCRRVPRSNPHCPKPPQDPGINPA